MSIVNYEVRRKKGESFESMLSRFTRGVMDTKVIKEYRGRSRFMSKAERKRFKRELAD